MGWSTRRTASVAAVLCMLLAYSLAVLADAGDAPLVTVSYANGATPPIRVLSEGCVIFRNHAWTLTNIPQELIGLKYTFHMGGGKPTDATILAPAQSTVYVIINADHGRDAMPNLNRGMIQDNWEKIGEAVYIGTPGDPNYMAVYRKTLNVDSTIAIPAPGWAGVTVAAQNLKSIKAGEAPPQNPPAGGNAPGGDAPPPSDIKGNKQGGDTNVTVATNIVGSDVDDTQPSTRPVRPITEVHGLAVEADDNGNEHGMCLDIIAQRNKRHDITIVGSVGDQMLLSLNEAIRVVDIEHPGTPKCGLELSFGDKYSAKDGGSAGTAFTLVLMSALGDFQLNPDAAITGDITVDQKVRIIGAVAEKVHGAALDECRLVAIPEGNAAALADDELLNGPSVLWEIQIFSVRRLDDAIAVMRKDPDAKMVKAMDLFDQLKADYGDKPIDALKSQDAQDRLKQIIALAPNHVSAKNLLQLAQGTGPTHLSAFSTIDLAVQAMGPMRDGLQGTTWHYESATNRTLSDTRIALQKIRNIADPDALPAIAAIWQFCDGYRDWAQGMVTEGNTDNVQQLGATLLLRRDDVLVAIQKVVSDKDAIDKMIRGG
jgi:Lon protease (S16) C-terminal proteolytic domain